jgi:hypothetical protein
MSSILREELLEILRNRKTVNGLPIQHDFIIDYIASEEAVEEAISKLSQGSKKEEDYVKATNQVLGFSPARNKKLLEDALFAIKKMIKYRLKKLY